MQRSHTVLVVNKGGWGWGGWGHIANAFARHVCDARRQILQRSMPVSGGPLEGDRLTYRILSLRKPRSSTSPLLPPLEYSTGLSFTFIHTWIYGPRPVPFEASSSRC